jgi:5-methylcytosine-specific restriction endonuclease McrA
MYNTVWYQNFSSAVKRSRKLRATPKWADIGKIKEIYRNCPDGYEVDHIIPLACKEASGLHCEFNLQYLTAKENQQKKNKLPELGLSQAKMEVAA